MSLNRLIEKHDLSDDVLEAFAARLTASAPLKELSSIVDLDPEKTYALARVYCREILQENLEDVVPALAEQREVMAKAKIRKMENQINAKTHRDILRNILEDLMLLKLEKKGKITESED